MENNNRKTATETYLYKILVIMAGKILSIKETKGFNIFKEIESFLMVQKIY
jgi:hypothetical protein